MNAFSAGLTIIGAVFGAVVSTVKRRISDTGTPAARTANAWSPSSSGSVVNEVVQSRGVPPSTEHWRAPRQRG